MRPKIDPLTRAVRLSARKQKFSAHRTERALKKALNGARAFSIAYEVDEALVLAFAARQVEETPLLIASEYGYGFWFDRIRDEGLGILKPDLYRPRLRLIKGGGE